MPGWELGRGAKAGHGFPPPPYFLSQELWSSRAVELGSWGAGELGSWGAGELGAGELGAEKPGSWGAGEQGSWGAWDLWSGELGGWGAGELGAEELGAGKLGSWGAGDAGMFIFIFFSFKYYTAQIGQRNRYSANLGCVTFERLKYYFYVFRFPMEMPF